MYLPIYFNNAVIDQLPVYDELALPRALMREDEIRVDLELYKTLNCPIGSYIIVNGRQYTVNTVPGFLKSAEREFTNNVVFEGEGYSLYDKKLRHLNNRTFQYYGKPADFAQLIVDNINQISTGWTVGVCEDIPEKPINFSGHDCRTALDEVAKAFDIEWDVKNKQISFPKKVGNVTPYVFEYGQGKGLYNIGYQYQDDKNVVTRVYGYGSTRNLPEGYRDGATQLMINGYYLEKNVYKNNDPAQGLLYGVKEGDYENQDIFPKVNGTVTGVSAYDADAATFVITDAGLTFDINANLSPNAAKVGFTSGELQGQEFEILKFDNATKQITLKVFVDGSNNKLPNTAFQAVIGDTYTLFDMFLPVESVTAAETELAAKMQEYLDENSVPRVVYNVELDPIYARDNAIYLEPGDQVRIKDADLGIDAMIRVTAANYPLHFPGKLIKDKTKIVIQIANDISPSLGVRAIAQVVENKTQIKVTNRVNTERARKNALDLRTLQGRIFNTDGGLSDGDGSLREGMKITGYDSQDFSLNNVIINRNVGGDVNKFSISGGTLSHNIYKIPAGHIWVISSNTWSGLDPAKYYYLYAKCSKVSLTGTWELSETQVAVNDIPGYYVFNFGQLYEVNSDGYRRLQSTKGTTTVIGNEIYTGLISSMDGETYFNLDTGEIGGKIIFKAGSSGYNNLIDKPDLSTLATDADVAIVAAEAMNAQDTADAVAELTSFLDTTVDGNVIASGTMLVGDTTGGNAGITGVSDSIDSTDPLHPINKSVRIFAGADYDNKEDAPFRVLDDGSVYMSKAIVSGIINAVSGKIGNFLIDNKGLKNTEDLDAYIIQEKTIAGEVVARAAMGTAVYSGDNRVGDFLNHADLPGDAPNYGLRVSVKNGSNAGLDLPFTGNEALYTEGDIHVTSGNLVADGQTWLRGSHIWLGELPTTPTKADHGTVMRRNSDGKLFVYYD